MVGHSERMRLGEAALADEKDCASLDERFAALVTRQSRFVFRVAHAVLRNSHDAEDVVQEVFLKLYRSRRWEKIEDERAYLARAAWRIAIDRRPNKTAENDLYLELPSPVETPEQAVVEAN